MPLIGTFGAGSGRGFGLTSGAGAPGFLCGCGGQNVTEDGDFRVHTFTGPGTFTLNFLGEGTPGSPNVVDYMVIGGAGAGANGTMSFDGGGAGAGGAGGFRASDGSASGSYTISPAASGVPGFTVCTSPGSYPVVVGAGGTVSGPGSGTNGSLTSAFGISSAGGGGVTYQNAGLPGASGGGAPGNSKPRGEGNLPPVSPPQGQPGGGPGPNSPSQRGGTGGGGATDFGCYQSSTGRGGTGGTGSQCHLIQAPCASAPSVFRTVYAGGGGGGSYTNLNPAFGSGPPPPVGTGLLPAGPGQCGAGSGAYTGGIFRNIYGPQGNNAAPGQTNSGSGGGGGGGTAEPNPNNQPGQFGALGGNGGAGRVVIRYRFK